MAGRWKATTDVCCSECGRWVAGRTPRQGDGSALKPFPHKDESGEWCIGRIFATADLDEMRDRKPATARTDLTATTTEERTDES